MAVIPVEGVPHFDFEGGGFSAEDLRVLRVHGTEEISQLYRYEIELASLDAQIDFASLVGQNGKLIWRDQEGDHWVHGVIVAFEQRGRGQRFTNYHAVLVPKVWTLNLRRQSRIFQNLSVPDILEEVLKSAGVPSDLYDLRVTGSYKPRVYCVQYRESDWNFAARLMEEEGIFYFFRQEEDTHTLVLADSAAAHEPIGGESTLPFRVPGVAVGDREQVHSFRYAQQVRHGAVMLRDFDFKKPSLNLQAKATGDAETELEFYDYPGEYPDLSGGNDLAEIRLQELRAGRFLGTGEGNCTRLVPGFRFTLEDHPRSDFNQEYIVTRVTHRVEQPQAAEEDAGEGEKNLYLNTFECVPSSVPYRPARRTRRPRVEGPQTAIVVGPSGEEVHTDEHGRVKVQFHWDREGKKNEKSSCWIRVSQGWAGAGWGMVVLPRLGQEVVVDFLEGDPDRPLITGRVYNGENPPPYALPGEKTKSTWKSNTSLGGGGSNELRFEDAAGSEEIYLHGQKDYNQVIENDRTEDIGHDRSLHVGHDKSEVVDNDKSIEVTANHTEAIGGDKSLKVSGSHSENVGNNMTISIGANLTEMVQVNYSESVGAAMELTVGAAFAQTVGGGSKVAIGGSSSETVGAEKTETYGADHSSQVSNSRSVQIGKSMELDVGENSTMSVVKNLGVKAKKISLVAEDELTIKVGSAQLTVKKNGDVMIKGKKINIKGSGDVVIKGSKIVEN